MICPECGSDNHRVTNSRDAPHNETRRRRECNQCNFRWTTYEIMDIMLYDQDRKRVRDIIQSEMFRAAHAVLGDLARKGKIELNL